MLEDTREPEQTPTVACRALWEHDDGTAYSFPYLFQTFEFFLVARCLERNSSGVGDHGPKRNDFETEDIRLRSQLSVFGGEGGGV